MQAAELAREIERGVSFWGVDGPDAQLAGVMGIQSVKDVTLVRHAYVLPEHQGKGFGSLLLQHLETHQSTNSDWNMVGRDVGDTLLPSARLHVDSARRDTTFARHILGHPAASGRNFRRIGEGSTTRANAAGVAVSFMNELTRALIKEFIRWGRHHRRGSAAA